VHVCVGCYYPMDSGCVVGDAWEVLANVRGNRGYPGSCALTLLLLVSSSLRVSSSPSARHISCIIHVQGSHQRIDGLLGVTVIYFVNVFVSDQWTAGFVSVRIKCRFGQNAHRVKYRPHLRMDQTWPTCLQPNGQNTCGVPSSEVVGDSSQAHALCLESVQFRIHDAGRGTSRTPRI
jgi:hypothetical protein